MAKKTVSMAICYDFDGTLAPGNMQEHSFLPQLGVEPGDFWARVRRLAIDQDSDEILAYMRLMIDLAHESRVPVRREDFRKLGAKLEFFPGVSGWFARINGYALAKGVKADHFIISSGLREMVEGTTIAREFKRIYASGFMFDENGAAQWPALAINYTTKTQYLFRINKGTLDVFDNSIINKFVLKEDRPTPFERMIYIGDGETDIPCFRLVKEEGGYSIAVYPKGKKGAKDRTEELTAGGRANLIAPADYEDGSVIDRSVKAIIDKLEAESRIAGSA
jgi:haloacid dehalogenase-like hydrolase